MKADLASKLQTAMRGGTPKTGVAGVMGVAGDPATCDKSLTLQWLRPLRVKTDKAANDAIRGVACGVTGQPEPNEVELEERKAVAAAGVGGSSCSAPRSALEGAKMLRSVISKIGPGRRFNGFLTSVILRVSEAHLAFERSLSPRVLGAYFLQTVWKELRLRGHNSPKLLAAMFEHSGAGLRL
jgi:hypothetical protein